MAKSKVEFECSNCGYTQPKWSGNCPSCGEWNTFVEKAKETKTASAHKAKIEGLESHQKPQSLKEVEINAASRKKTGINEFDRVLGGGILPGAYILLGGEPGIGKSTLTLQIAKSNPDLDILYCAGEESASQIKQRAERIGVKSEKLKIYSETQISKIIETVQQDTPELLIIDSIQTMYRSVLQSMPGSIQQVKECAALIQQLSKKLELPTIMIGHVTKEGDIAGPRVLEHMVDTVLQFEGDSHYAYRLLRSLKNRFGPAQEVGVFEMLEEGLTEVTNPSTFFISTSGDEVSGSALTCTMEGSRPLIVEVQALVTPSTYATAQRTASGFDRNRLLLILAVLEKRCGYAFSSQDVFLNIVGGFKINDPAADLAVAMALISSYKDIPIQNGAYLIGEVGSGGEIRTVPHMEKRTQEATKMGLNRGVVPNGYNGKTEVLTTQYIQDAIKKALTGNERCKSSNIYKTYGTRRMVYFCGQIC